MDAAQDLIVQAQPREVSFSQVYPQRLVGHGHQLACANLVDHLGRRTAARDVVEHDARLTTNTFVIDHKVLIEQGCSYVDVRLLHKSVILPGVVMRVRVRVAILNWCGYFKLYVPRVVITSTFYTSKTPFDYPPQVSTWGHRT